MAGTFKIQKFLPFDNTTLANYKTWAQGYGAGPAQTLTAVSVSGATATYSCTNGNVNLGERAVIAGFTNAGNNGTFTITGVTGNPGALTAFTVTNASAVNETHAATANTGAMLALGWKLVNDAGQVNWSNVTTQPSSAIPFPTTNIFNWRGAFSAGSTYAVGDIVTSSGLTFICGTAIAVETLSSVAVSGATTTYNGSSMHVSVGDTVVIAGFTNAGNNGTFTVNTATGSWGSVTTFTVTTTTQIAETHAATELNGTPPQNNVLPPTGSSILHHWGTYNYEVWQSNGPLSATAPIFLKLIYGASTGGSGNPTILFQIGTSQVNGVIGGNLFNAGVLIGVGCAIPAGQFGSTPLENDFCGNADKVAMGVFMGVQQLKGVNSGGIIAIDRAHDASGGDLDTYTAVAVLCQGVSGTIIGAAQLLYKAGSGSVWPPISQPWPVIAYGNNQSTSFNGQTAALPLFFTPGYMANPMLGAMATGFNDMAPSGSLFNVYLYGTSHTFMAMKATTGPGSSNSIQGAIQWE